MLARLIHAVELRRWRQDKNRRVLPFDWGLEFLGHDNRHPPGAFLSGFVDDVMADSAAFFSAPAVGDYKLQGDLLSFTSAVVTPYAENNTVYCRAFLAPSSGRAVLVLPHWNADAGSHIAFCRLMNRLGVAALRLSLPYHDLRRPQGAVRADHMISPNIGRTIAAVRQAVIDVRHAADWLLAQGYTRLAIVGTSVGSCVGFLAFAHDERFNVGGFNHVSSYFADVVWHGLSTQHVRRGLEPHVGLDELRCYWSVISPKPFVRRLMSFSAQRPILMISGRYDPTFLPHLSRDIMAEFERYGIPYKKLIMPCGHYTLGLFPFSLIAALGMAAFIRAKLK